MKALGFITERSRVQMIPEDQLLAQALKDLGITVFPIPWEEPGSFQKLDMALFRTPWNYYQKLPEFLDFLKMVEATKVPTYNPPSQILWNIDKNYLRDLEKHHVPIIPTLFVKPSEFSPDMEWPESALDVYVIKPAISATAARTFRGDRLYISDILTEENIYRPNETLMIQPFIESVVTEGEYALVYFDGEFSHAVLKKPKSNDFRVQEEHGGSWDSATPSKEMLQVGHKALSALGSPPLYARVDLVRNGPGFQLMELELFEPMLYIRQISEAHRLAQGIHRRI